MFQTESSFGDRAFAFAAATRDSSQVPFSTTVGENNITYHHINFMPSYTHLSPDELRFNDYKLCADPSSLSSEALFKLALAVREVQLLKQWLRRPDLVLSDEPLLQVVHRYADSYNLASGVQEFVSDLIEVKPPDKASGVQLQKHLMTALEHFNADMVALILRLGVVNPSAFVDKSDPPSLNYSRAPLMAVYENPHDEERIWMITRLLIEAKANTDNIDSDGASLHLAQLAQLVSTRSFEKLAQFLESHESVHALLNRPVRVWSSLGWSFANVAVRTLYAQFSLLHSAALPFFRCESGRLASTYSMVSNLARPRQKTDLVVDALKLLASHKADLSAPSILETTGGKKELTLLMHAMMLEDRQLVRALLDMNADPGVETSSGVCAFRTVQPCLFKLKECVSVVRSAYKSMLQPVLCAFLSPDTAGLVARYVTDTIEGDHKLEKPHFKNGQGVLRLMTPTFHFGNAYLSRFTVESELPHEPASSETRYQLRARGGVGPYHAQPDEIVAWESDFFEGENAKTTSADDTKRELSYVPTRHWMQKPGKIGESDEDSTTVCPQASKGDLRLDRAYKHMNLYQCMTCDPTNIRSVCRACCIVCHAGPDHDVVFLSRHGSAYCHCQFDNACRLVKLEPEHAVTSFHTD